MSNYESTKIPNQQNKPDKAIPKTPKAHPDNGSVWDVYAFNVSDVWVRCIDECGEKEQKKRLDKHDEWRDEWVEL